MNPLKSLLLVASLAGITAPAQSADHPRPGLWQLTLDIRMKGGPQISPEDLAMMKQMGIAIPGGGDPVVTQRCITPEMAASDQAFQHGMRGNDGCELKQLVRRGNKLAGEMICDGEMKGGGPFEMTQDSETAYHGRWTIKGLSRNDGPIEQNFALSGKWLKSACDQVR